MVVLPGPEKIEHAGNSAKGSCNPDEYCYFRDWDCVDEFAEKHERKNQKNAAYLVHFCLLVGGWFGGADYIIADINYFVNRTLKGLDSMSVKCPISGRGA